MSAEGEALQTAPTFAGLDSSPAAVDAARFIVVPVPYEATTEFLPGTRHAPDRIIHCSRMLELYDHVLDTDISTAGIATAATLEPVLSGPEAMVAAVEREVASWLGRHKVPVIIGGEHTVALGAIRALRQRHRYLSVLHLDAHADLRDEYLGARVSQATVMRRVHELCPVSQFGIRSLSAAERRYISEQRMHTVFWPPASTNWLPGLVESLTDTVYVSIDADVFDSGFLPGVGTPEPGGPGWEEVWSLLAAVTRSRQIVSFDIVELAPNGAIGDTCAYTLSKLVYRFIGSIQRNQRQQEASRHG